VAIKVLWLTENFPPNNGGMAQSCDRIISGLRARGVIVDIAHFTTRKAAFTITHQINGRYFALPKLADTSHSLNLGLSFLEHHVDHTDYSVMIIFGGQHPMNAAPIYSKLLQLPYYLCLRGNDFDLSLFDNKRRLILNEAVHNSRGVLTGSQDKLARLKKIYPKTPTHYTPNGIDLQQWQALDSEKLLAENWRANNVSANKTVIGMLGYLKEKKGLQFFLKAMLKSQQHEHIHLLLSGEQPTSVQSFLSENKFHVSVIPFSDRFDLLKSFLVCDWVAIPSYYEGMPNVMLEAGGLGVPIIASNVDGMRDIIEHDKNGLLFRPVDVHDCARVVVSAVTMSTQKRQAMGNALHTKVSKRLSTSREIACYLDILKADSPSNNSPISGEHA